MTNNGNWSVMSENTLSEQFPLHRACRDGDVSALSVLLNQLDTARTHLTLEDTYYGWTPTHWAAYFGKLECLKVLLCGTGNGVAATPGLKTSRFQQTPIHIAAFAGHPHCLQWLLQAGADPNAQDYLGETSLHKAARTGATECVDLLALNNAKIGLQNNNSQTAAQLANACSYTALAHHLLLLEGKQDVNGSIARSVPAHGLNGGVFPHSANSALFSNTLMSQASNGCKAPDTNGTAVNGSVNGQANGSAVCTSSNGYYGFQHTNGQTNGHQNAEAIEDCDMETDAAPISNGHNGSTNGQENGSEATIPNAEKNGFSNGQTNGSNNLSLGFTNGHVIGTVLGFTNGQSLTNGPKVNGTSAVNGNSHSTNGTNGFTFKSHNAIGEDITLNKAVSQNHVPIAGCKRSREEGCFPEIKRMRTEDTCAYSAMNTERSESIVHAVVANVDVVAGVSGVGSGIEVQHGETNACGTQKGWQNLLDNTPVSDSCTSQTVHLTNDSDKASTLNGSAIPTASSVSAPRASGPSNGSPAPIPAPLPQYSLTMGCLDAHYPRCLMGHYF